MFSFKTALDSSGRQAVKLSSEFKMTRAGVVQSGACTAHPLPDADSVLQFSDSIAKVLPQNGYCTYLIPEYHDDQQLRVNDNTDYGPVVWTFASPWVANYTRPADFEDTLWLNVAIVKVDAYSGALPPEYQNLHLQVGFNCMFLHHDTSQSPRHWVGAMIKASKDLDCGGLTVTAADTLPVYDEHQFPNADDYPPVTRIIESADTRTYIGVRCGQSWCVVGATFPQVPKASFDGVAKAGMSSRWRVKGWFDEQHLGVIQPTSGVRPRVLSAVVPSDSLEDFQAADYINDWKLVATVYMADTPQGKYALKGNGGYGFVKDFNKVWLRAAKVHVPNAPDTLVWTSAIGDDPASAIAKRVDRSDHTGDSLPVPWTARWRWVTGDEQLWVACMNGCCMVKPDNQ